MTPIATLNRRAATNPHITPMATLHHRATTNPNGVAFIYGDDRWTYARLAANAERLARGLAGRGIRTGDRIALHMPNQPELAVAFYACFHLGAIAVPLNNRLTTAELAPLLQRLQPALYVGHAELYRQVAAIDFSILPLERRFVAGGTREDTRAQPWRDLLSDASAAAPAVSDIHSPAVLLATSGTTGVPKLVIHTQATLAATADLTEHYEIDGDQIAIVACPMVHASGLFTFLGCIRFGAPLILLERFDPDAVLEAIERHRCSWMLGLPFMLAAILQSQQRRTRKVESLRVCLTGGDVCPPPLQQAFSAVFGVPLRSFWGATEAVGSLTYGLEPGPVSSIVPGAQIRLVDDAGVPVPLGEVGELLVRGPNVSIGYWAGPGAIEAPENGWYDTGDLMRQDEKGDLWFVSRKKDLIVRGGSNISPVEVERVLAAHPAVKDAAVVGVPDETLGQRVAGFVQLETSRIMNDVLDTARDQLADYKVPERLQAVAEIPRNALGKADRKALLAMITQGGREPAV